MGSRALRGPMRVLLFMTRLPPSHIASLTMSRDLGPSSPGCRPMQMVWVQDPSWRALRQPAQRIAPFVARAAHVAVGLF